MFVENYKRRVLLDLNKKYFKSFDVEVNLCKFVSY